MIDRNISPDEDGTGEARTPVVRYAARSKTGEDTNESTASQVAQINAKLAEVGGRTVRGEPHEDHASGSKSNRGPALAKAIKEATELAERYGTAELWVFHSSRLGRGSGKKGGARALGRLLYELQAQGVTVRSVTDDEFTTNEMLWGFASRQAAKYSEDLSAHVKRGYEQAAERGSAAWLARGIRTAGYQVLRTVDDHGRVAHQAIKHPEDAWIIELIFGMATAGHSAQAIQLELSSRGAMTRPVRRDHSARPFDTTRINQILDNPAYAGLVVHKGKVVGPGDWPRYIEPEDWTRIREERRERAHVTRRKVGRPPLGYLLSELAVCSQCGGSMRAVTDRKVRRDGTRLRSYICTAHITHHRDSAEWCRALPFDAAGVDRIVIGGIDTLLLDADNLREQLSAGRTADIERLGEVAASAREDAAKADRVVLKAQERYERALQEDDDEAADIALTAVRNQREEAERARARLNAALDALNVEPEADDGDVLARIWHALSGQVADAQGDIRKLNAALREWFDRFELHGGRDGYRVVPVLSTRAVELALREPQRSPHVYEAISARASGDPDEVIEINGCIYEITDLGRMPALAGVQKSPLTSQKAIVRPS